MEQVAEKLHLTQGELTSAAKACIERTGVIAAVNLSSLMRSFTQRYQDILYSFG